MSVIKKLSKSQSGFSMTELTVAGAIGGVLLLVGRQLMVEHSKQEANIKARSDVAQAVSLLEHSLRNKTICKSVFNGVGVDTNPSQLSYVNERGDTVSLIRDNTDYGSFRLNTGDIYIADYPAGQNQDLINLNLTFRLKPNAGEGIIQKRIPLTVSVDSSANILECGSVLADASIVSEQKFCESLGATLATWNGTDCVLNAVSCPHGKIVESMNQLGDLNCVDALTKVDTNNLFDTTPKDCTGMTDFKLVSLNGKITVECTGGSCTPLPACPDFSPEYSLSSQNTLHASWSSQGWDPALIEYRRVVSPHCRVDLRVSTSCQNGSRQCLYSPETSTGAPPNSCPSSGGGTCTPIPSCPVPWTAQMSLTNDNTTHGLSWTYNTSLTEYLHSGDNGGDCRLFLRADTSCSAVNEFRICEYDDSAYTGCANPAYTSGGGACIPPTCPSVSAPTTLTSSSVLTQTWVDAGKDGGEIFDREYQVGMTSCWVTMRASTSCNATYEGRRCVYSHPAGGGWCEAIGP